MESSLQSSIIDGYHLLIKERYQYFKIKQRYAIPDSVTEDKFNLLRDYFLNHIYPKSEKREILDRAFNSLDGHLKNPKHLIKIILDSGKVIWKLGWHFPKTMQVALKALKSFRVASQMEKKLLTTAIDKKKTVPLSTGDVKELIAGLPQEQLFKFIDDGMILFETLYDRDLIARILKTIDQVLGIMRNKPEVYSAHEIAGMELGFQVLQDGNALFDALSPYEQNVLFNLIKKIETEALMKIVEEHL